MSQKEVLKTMMVSAVDIMSFDDTGKIIEFKAIIHPLKAVKLMHARMKAMLEEMSAK